MSDAPEDWRYETRVELTRLEDSWQVEWSPDLVAPDLTSDEELRLVRTRPKRADILDRDGTPVMTEREVEVVGIDKAQAGAAAGVSAAQLADLLGIDVPAFVAKVGAAGSRAFVEAITLRVTDPVLARVRARLDAVSGARRLPQLRVLGPTRTWAAPVLGSVAPATAEQIQRSGGILEPGDDVGQQGLQFRYDERLRGTPGLAVQAVRRGADDSVVARRELFAAASQPGEPLRTTLDSAAQTAAEAALAGTMTDTPTALVVVQPSSGEILAAAVGPAARGSTLALAGKAPPGSTFKIASSLALVRHGVTADSRLPCTDTLVVNGRRFGNYTGYPAAQLGDITLRTAFAYSCNTAFISQHAAVTQPDLIAAAQSLGMGEDLDLGFTGFLGSVPATDDVVEHAASFIGQGRVEASPLAMAVVTASVMPGATVRPKLIADGAALPPPPTPLTQAEATVLRDEMGAVVREGSGRVLQQAGVEYAKTGTAEFGTTEPPKTHAWMVAAKGDLAVAAFNQEGPSGATHAAPFVNAYSP